MILNITSMKAPLKIRYSTIIPSWFYEGQLRHFIRRDEPSVRPSDSPVVGSLAPPTPYARVQKSHPYTGNDKTN